MSALTTTLRPKKYPILNFKRQFCPMLMNRIYPFIQWNAELGGGKFLLFLNIADRSSKISLEKEDLLYGGMLELREFMEHKEPVKRLNGNWEALKNGVIAVEEAKEGGGLYNNFRNGILGLEDIFVGDLKDYFRSYSEGKGFANFYQEQEHPILDYHFDLDKDHFLSLPLILFGKLDGVVHIIFEHKLLNKLNNPTAWKIIIRGLSAVYEGLLLTWDIVGANMSIDSLVKEELDYVTGPVFQEAEDTNKFFKELNYLQYYEKTYDYFLKRVELNNAVPDSIKREHRRRAIISILIDSYAHNISAHSLTVLKWWFQQRALNLGSKNSVEELEKKFPIAEWGAPIISFLEKVSQGRYKSQDIEAGLKRELARWYSIMKKDDNEADFKAVRDQFSSLERELTPLFKFLLEKGAFWSGVTRDQQFGGEIHNLYEILWGDFIQNPLYLGTIAYSEGITRLNIHVRIYEETKKRARVDDYHWLYQLKKNEEGILLDGVLAQVDVGGVPNQRLQHLFVRKGDRYEELRSALSACEIFFPGGVVGKHAFFTLLENEIRNVKHYGEEDLKEMRLNGLDLVISVRPSGIGTNLTRNNEAPAGYDKESVRIDLKSLYKIGIWLGHSTRLQKQSDHLVLSRFGRLMEDVITEDTNAARLGGTYQDKICAAMLFNNTFISVEEQEKDRDKAFYPWVRTAISSGLGAEGSTEEDLEIDINNFDKAQQELSWEDLPERGFFKKYVHLWRGDFLIHLNSGEELELENVNRFRIVNLPTQDEEVKSGLQKIGAIRILQGENANISPIPAYHAWLKKWFKEPDFAIKMLQGQTEIAYIFFDESQARYFIKANFFKLPDEEQEEYGEYLNDESLTLKFTHSSMTGPGGKDTLNIRSHGVFKQKFFPDVTGMKDFSGGQLAELELYEFIEVLKTRVCIFDKRIADRVPESKLAILSEQLACDVYREDLSDWQKVRAVGLAKYHFIIMHLSFIEAMTYLGTGENAHMTGKKYGEEGIVDFVQEQLIKEKEKEKEEVILNDNTILVITTGRGRTAWWGKLQNSQYAPFSTFRPVESLIEAVEKAVLKNDDIEIKYNLIKVLFGS